MFSVYQVPTLFKALEDIFTRLLRFKSVRFKVAACLCFDNHLEECAIFLQSCVFFAQLPPRRAALLFYWIQDDGDRVRKSRAQSPNFILLSPAGGRVMEETRGWKNKKYIKKLDNKPRLAFLAFVG